MVGRRKKSANSFIAGTLHLVKGSSLGQFLNIATLPILTHLYSAEEMGALGIFLSYFGIATFLTCLRYNTAIVSAETRNEAVALFLLTCLLCIPTSVLAGSVLCFFITTNTLSFGNLHPSAGLIMMLLLIFTGCRGVIRYWALRNGRFRLMSKLLLYQGIARAVVQVGGGIVHLGWIALFLGELCGRMAGIRSTWSYIRLSLRHSVRVIRREDLRIVFFKYLHFFRMGLPAALLEAATELLPVILIGSLYDMAQAGHFSLAQRAWYLPVTIIGTSVADTFHSKAAKLFLDRPKDLPGLFLAVSGKLALLAVLPALGVFVAGPYVASYLLGSEWETAGQFASLLTPWYLLQLIILPVCRITEVAQRQQIRVIYHASTLLYTCLIAFLASIFRWNPITMVGFLSLGMGISYLFYYLCLLRMCVFTARLIRAETKG